MKLIIKTGARILICMLLATLAGCSWNTNREDGPEKSSFNIKSIGKSDIDDVLDVHVREVRQYLRELMIKLYKRNPKELKKSRYQDINKNLARVFDEIHNWKYEELNKRKSVDAIQLTFDDSYEGDRVFSFIAGLTSMIMATYGDKTDFYMFDTVDAQKLYNSARNIEIAVWKLEHDTDENGELYLYSNSLPGEPVNLSYERLFGKLIATQDTIAIIIAEKTNRAIKTVLQTMASAVFLPI